MRNTLSSDSIDQVFSKCDMLCGLNERDCVKDASRTIKLESYDVVSIFANT